ncbi:MAG: hypothetical protein QUV08_13970 [Parasphingorhabdus sp.]|nr:hypothetical protein [Parasphingorhabdus sp.]|tara:strand:+ start:16025 stop:16186 length:162 start_codon:yes stop_codon:yes gene_type:complete
MSEIDPNKAPMSPEEQRAYQARQKQRAVIMAGLLMFMVVLFYLITIVKIGSSS